jgi:hypothetical protein
MKKETLEEAAENHLQKWRLLNNIHLSNILHAERCKNDFIAGAKWQQERMYSEEEVIKILYQFHYDLVNSNFDTKEEWFNEFKKK